MFGVLMFFFIILCLILAFLIFMQQGKGDMGLGSMGGGTQTLFGGSGGQNFFEKLTWTLGAIFILGSLGLSVLKSKEVRKSRLEGFALQQNETSSQQLPMDASQPEESDSE